MVQEPSFEAVKRRLAEHSPSAAEVVNRRHFDRIVRLAQGQIGRRYQGKVDAEDIANSVLKSFFHRYADHPDGLSDWQGLWRLLAEIAENKLRNRVRRFRQKKRDVDRELPHDAFGRDPAGEAVDRGAGDFASDRRLPDRLLDGPDDEAEVRDLLAHLFRDYSDDKRRVIELSLQGYKVEEIAELSRVSDRTVCRIRDRFKQRLEAERASGLADTEPAEPG